MTEEELRFAAPILEVKPEKLIKLHDLYYKKNEIIKKKKKMKEIIPRNYKNFNFNRVVEKNKMARSRGLYDKKYKR